VSSPRSGKERGTASRRRRPAHADRRGRHAARDLRDPSDSRKQYGASGPMARTLPATARASTTTGSTGVGRCGRRVETVAGHRLGTMEVESALVDHPKVAEAAVVASRTRSRVRPWRHCDAQGGAERRPTPSRGAGRSTSSRKIGAIARPDRSCSPRICPKTRRARSCPVLREHRGGQGPRRHDHACGSLGGGRG